MKNHLNNLVVPACRLLEKLGLRREGEFVKNRWVHGEWTNSIWYAALEEEYLAAENTPPQTG